MEINKNFIGSKMNKSLDERLVPKGQYKDALNIRVGSDEDGEAGSIENAKGNEMLTNLEYNGAPLINAMCIGAAVDDSKETIYWFVTSDNVDMIVSYNARIKLLNYHVISETVLNFSKDSKINCINLIDNLLFWTDNRNQPRKINVTEKYLHPSGGVDQITEDDISVIVKPPMNSPDITLFKNGTEENYIEDKFLYFSYRYRYKDGEYSALSEFSEAAFEPGPFAIDYGSYSNIGMKNTYNAVDIKVNTGSKRVVGFDICYKQSGSNVVNVIKRFNKKDLGLSDNTDFSYRFDNKSIYTTLQPSELLRAFDNVPRRAKSQTTIGNRIFYGNYVDGYNVDENVDFDLELVSEDISTEIIDTTKSNGADYTIDTATSVPESTLNIDLSNVDLTSGSTIYIDFNLEHSQFGGDPSYDDGLNMVYNDFVYNFAYTLPSDYSTVSELVSSQDFIDSIKSSLTFAQSADGYSLTDFFNRGVVSKSGWTVVGTGVTSDQGDFEISSSDSILVIQVPAIKFVSDADPAIFAYEYLRNNSVTASFSNTSSSKSLHSNRSYEFGIVYMDDYKRATTALVPDSYSVFVPAKFSQDKNSVRAVINSKAPEWATNYRFVMKPSAGAYDTIYASIYYQDPRDGGWWIRLEGENQTKAKVGDILYVKRDTNGALSRPVKTTVIDFKTQEEDFILGNKNPENPNEDLIELQGTYMKLIPSSFQISYNENQFISFGEKKVSAEGTDFSTFLKGLSVFGLVFSSAQTFVADILNSNSDGKPRLGYPMYYYDEANAPVEYEIPSGTKVRFHFNAFRFGRKRGGCRSRYWEFDKEFVATRNYANMYDFIVGENIDFEAPSNNPEVESSDDTKPRLEWDNTRGTEYPAPQNGVHKLRYMDIDGKPYLVFQSGDNRCGGKRSYLTMNVEVNLSGSQLIFETEPEEVSSDVFYESDKSYPIVNGNHTGNVQDQTTSLPAIVELGFFNCYSFGNGAESFKVFDKIATQRLEISPRVTAVSEQEYKEAHRYADITYSGVYNEETNVNNLNVFNLGLANYKSLERLFGPINMLHGRQTDILVLQEDKISYLLAGKNLLSDSVGGGTITSVPEVLGTQVSRTEEFGISDDADSFDSFGYDVFFTDTKRGAVLNLRGGSMNSDNITLISDAGMRSWFRDSFNDYGNRIKLGAYDPYTREYVLSFTDESLPIDPQVMECGKSVSGSGDFSARVTSESTATGSVTITYNVSSESEISVTYNDAVVVNETITGSGSVTFDKTSNKVNEYEVLLSTNGSWSIDLGCVETVPLSIVTVVTADTVDTGLSGTQGFSWNTATISSPASKLTVNFIDDPMDYYSVVDGFESEGYFPTEGATVRMTAGNLSRSFIAGTDKMYYMVSDTLYDNIGDILSNATEVTNIQQTSSVASQGTFPYVNPSNHRYLYVVYRYVSDASGIPFAYNQRLDAIQNTDLNITLTAFDPDNDPLTYTIVTNPLHGTLSGTAPNLTYTPNLDYLGLDTFKFKVNDGTNDSNVATIGITVDSLTLFLNSFDMSLGGDPTQLGACALTVTGNLYHDGLLETPGIGDVVYYDDKGSIPFNGLDKWYKISTGQVIQIDVNGTVQDIQIC